MWSVFAWGMTALPRKSGSSRCLVVEKKGEMLRGRKKKTGNKLKFVTAKKEEIQCLDAWSKHSGSRRQVRLAT
ncbi:hypothetical protein GE21DRAFT_1103873 [Neurospora crassa]|nr:hypothetical protein GE21DRAFT_1103873 [Neurospora crassa]